MLIFSEESHSVTFPVYISYPPPDGKYGTVGMSFLGIFLNQLSLYLPCPFEIGNKTVFVQFLNGECTAEILPLRKISAVKDRTNGLLSPVSSSRQ